MILIRAIPVLLLLLLASGGFVSAQAPDPLTREEAIRESLININSPHVIVAAQAARYLGIFQAKEGVRPMLKALNQKGFRALSEHHTSNTPGGVSMWTFVSVREDIIVALAAIKDPRAVPVLKKYLTKERPADTGPSFNQNVAWALFQITGRLYKYRDSDGVIKEFKPRETAP